MTDPTNARLALLSVSDKSNLVPLAQGLIQRGYTLVSTGGTARAIADAGLPVTPIEQLTGFPEMMDGRVKTLHPKVHGGILARRDLKSHTDAMRTHNIGAIDLVCVNLYPFRETIVKDGVTTAEAIEQIDIGGPSMVRSAAKNHASVTILTDPAQYGRVLKELLENKGETSLATRRELAAEAFAHTAGYDATIATYLGSINEQGDHDPSIPPLVTPALRRDRTLRYGENPHQTAALYHDHHAGEGLASAQQLHGKELSYNNLADAAAALEVAAGARPIVEALYDNNACAASVVKHTNPCGFAIASDPAEAVRLAIAGDPMAAYGGILALDGPVTDEAATVIAADDRFFEVVIARSFDDDALERLRNRWKMVRLLATGDATPTASNTAEYQFRTIPGGALGQSRDTQTANPADWTHAAGPKPDAETLRAAAALEWACRGLSSNAVCLGGLDPDAPSGSVRLFGAGAGQMDRVASCRLAVAKAGDLARGSIAASDAFFPFPDGPEILIDAGAKVIVHPGGAKRDAETFELCEARGVTCLTTGVRRFRH